MPGQEPHDSDYHVYSACQAALHPVAAEGHFGKTRPSSCPWQG